MVLITLDINKAFNSPPWEKTMEVLNKYGNNWKLLKNQISNT